MMAKKILPILHFGATGPVVADLQADLRAAGLNPGDNMGIYDNETTAAVRAFQESQKLEATGDVDSATRQALDLRLGRVQDPAFGVDDGDDADVIPLHPELASDVKRVIDRPKSTALVPVVQYPVQVIGAAPESDPFYKSPIFILGAIAIAAGAAYYFAKSGESKPFESFEDAEALDTMSRDRMILGDPPALSARRRRRRRKPAAVRPQKEATRAAPPKRA